MDAKQVTDKILSDAQCQADEIKLEAEKKLSVERGALSEELNQFKEDSERLAVKAAQDTRDQILAGARMEIAKDTLGEKRAILDGVFDKAKEKLLNMSDDEYKAFIKKLMLKAVETGDEQVIVDIKETHVDQRLIDEVNAQLKSNMKGQLKLSDEKRNIKAGFILKRGKIMNNASLDVLISQAKKELEIQLAKKLFKD